MDDQAPDIRPNLSPMRVGVRIQFPGVGAVTIPDLDVAGFLAAYPWGWATLYMVEPDQVAKTQGDRVTASAIVSLKQLLAAAVIREFPEPREGRTVPSDDLPGPVFSDAQEMAGRVLDTSDPEALTALLASLFNWPPDGMRDVVDANLQRDAR